MIVGYAPGVWDLLHVGHIRFLKRAKGFCDRLIVGCPSDKTVEADKNCYPIIPLEQRIEMLESISFVDAVVPYFALEFLTNLKMVKPQVMLVGSQWGCAERHREAEDWCMANDCAFRMIPYTSLTSTSIIKEKICRASL